MDMLLLPGEFSVCKLSSLEGVDCAAEFLFLAKTDDELSLVCPSACVPKSADRVQPGFSALKVRGPLDFSLVGIIAGISGILAEAGISVFVVSTYDTDYLLVPSSECARAMERLEAAGHRTIGAPPAHMPPG